MTGSSGDFDKLVKSIMDANKNETPKSEEVANRVIEKLSADLETQKEINKENKFVFFIISLIFFNVLLLKEFGWGAALSVLLPESILIIGAAHKYGLDNAVEIIDKIIHRFT